MDLYMAQIECEQDPEVTNPNVTTREANQLERGPCENHPVFHLEDRQVETQQQEPIDTTGLVEELSTTVEDNKLKVLPLTRYHENNLTYLQNILRIEMERHARAKALEEVTVSTVESQIQELQETEKRLKRDILELRASKEELQQELLMEQLNRTQLKAHMEKNMELEYILNQSIKTLHNRHKQILENTKELENVDKEQWEKYQISKKEVQRQICKENENQANLQKDINEENDQYERRCEEIHKQQMILIEEIEQEKKEIGELEQKCEGVKALHKENQKVEQELFSECEKLNCLIQTIDLEELQTQLEKQTENNGNILKSTQKELDDLNNSCEHLNQMKASLSASLDEQVGVFQGLQKVVDECEEELVNCLQEQEKIVDSEKILESELNEINELRIKVDETNGEAAKINENIIQIHRDKEEKVKQLNFLEKTSQEAAMKMSNLKEREEQLTKVFEANQKKHSECKQKKLDLESENSKLQSHIEGLKETYLKKEENYQNELEEIERELALLQEAKDKIQKDCDVQINSLNNDLQYYQCETEKKNEENSTKNEQTLKELQERVQIANAELQKENDHVKYCESVIFQKKKSLMDLQAELEFVQVGRTKQGTSNSASILKSPGQLGFSKSVTWRVPSHSSIGTSSDEQLRLRPKQATKNSGNILKSSRQPTSSKSVTGKVTSHSGIGTSDEQEYRSTADSLFAELLRNSPPKKLTLDEQKYKRFRME